MADTIYKLIPEDYDYLPVNMQVADGAVEILKMYVQAEEITWKNFRNPIFVDCGNNLETISCPFCGHRIDINLWHEMMSSCYESTSFNSLDIFLQCCNKKATLNNLKYQMGCGFAKFVIEIINPLEPPCKQDIFEASKCFGELKLKMIEARY